MATATKKTVEVPVTTITREERVILELTTNEAQAIADVFGAVSGDCRTSRRQFISSVAAALRTAGFPSYAWAPDKTGSIRFSHEQEIPCCFSESNKSTSIEPGSWPVEPGWPVARWTAPSP